MVTEELDEEVGIEVLKDRIISRIEMDNKKYADGNHITFYMEDGHVYKMYHEQDCCEGVYIDDIIGNIDDLINSRVYMAEEVVEEDKTITDGSGTWTFYKLATLKGYVTLRWYGASNGYYSEGVSFVLIKKPEPKQERISISFINQSINLS